MDQKFFFNMRLQSLGSVAPLNIFFSKEKLLSQVSNKNIEWKPYNPGKANFNRFGISLTSLKGETDGRIDLNSLYEYNVDNGTDYDEMSFRTPTPYWNDLSETTKPIEGFLPHLGRTHILRLDRGGFFPPHRDMDDAFRLIAFLGTSSNDCFFMVDEKKVVYDTDRLYYVNTNLAHSLFSFTDNSYILVLNVEPNQESYDLVRDSLEAL